MPRIHRPYLLHALAALLLTACGGGGGGGGDLASGAGDAALAGHVLNRMAYGPTPALLAQLTDEGVEGYVAAQLAPDTIDESGNAALNTLLAQIPVPASEYDLATYEDLARHQIVRALYSERQLLEQLTDFWENHFHTGFDKTDSYFGFDGQTATYLEWRENELLRQGALGDFHGLLLASATSPTMLIYLDNVSNLASAPNENYARELVELHTMGVDNGYDEDDIEEIARCFTGWTVCQVAPGDVENPLASCAPGPGSRWSFHFDPAKHDPGPKVIFAGRPHELALPARPGLLGIQDGFDLLAHLATLPQTAQFVSTKLVRKFVSDQPPPALVNACVAEWLATGGDLRAVMGVILGSSGFRDEATFGGKVRTPLESMIATVRAFGGSTASLTPIDGIRAELDGIAQQGLFRWPDPDGFPETGDAQLGSAKFLSRVDYNLSLAAFDPDGFRYDLPALMAADNVPPADADAIVDWLFDLLFQRPLSDEEHALAVDFLLTLPGGQVVPLDPLAPEYGLRVHALGVLVASYPQALQQ